MATLKAASATDQGQIRTQNEDHLHVADTLFVVADGMGGHQAGEVASRLAVQRLRELLSDDVEHSISEVVAAITLANDEIIGESTDNPDTQGMGTTITSLSVVRDPFGEEVLALANVGDSRAYLMRHQRLRQITIDHSYVQELVAEGHISRDEARTHPRRNIVTRALGIEPGVRVDSWTFPIIKGDRFMLCSDGLVDEVGDDEIAEVMRKQKEPQAAADELVRLANAHGGRDNISVVVVDVLEGDDPPDPTEEIDVIPTWATDDTGEYPAPSDSVAEAAIAAAAEPLTIATDIAEQQDDETAATATSTTTVDDAVDDATATDEALLHDTSETPPAGRSGGFTRFVLGVLLAAVLVFGFALFATWARSGYYIGFAGNDVVIYQGQTDGVLWFDATIEQRMDFMRDELDTDGVAFVNENQRFANANSAFEFATERLSTTVVATPTTTTTTPTTPTTTTPTSDTSATPPTITEP